MAFRIQAQARRKQFNSIEAQKKESTKVLKSIEFYQHELDAHRQFSLNNYVLCFVLYTHT